MNTTMETLVMFGPWTKREAKRLVCSAKRGTGGLMAGEVPAGFRPL